MREIYLCFYHHIPRLSVDTLIQNPLPPTADTTMTLGGLSPPFQASADMWMTPNNVCQMARLCFFFISIGKRKR